jgi:F420-0:gamma-glutamyl ligase
LDSVIIRAFEQYGLVPRTGDVVAIASKIVSIAEGQLIELNSVCPSKFASVLAAKWSLDKRLSQIILDEADVILGGVKGFMLTIKYGILTPNAGVDQRLHGQSLQT